MSEGAPGAARAGSSTRAWIGALLGLVLLAWLIVRSQFLIDDAFISFRYARNWAEGLGPVYNPGVDPPVEGYSNFLWVALLALGAKLGALPEVFCHLLSIAAAGSVLLLTHLVLLRRMRLDGWSAGLATLALAALPPFHVWATSGLETALYGLFLFGSWMLLTAHTGDRELRVGLLAGLCGAGLVLTRVEGFLWVAGILVASAVTGHLTRRRVLAYLGVAWGVMLVHLLWRHSVYGEWVANTVHAKAGLSGLTLARGARNLATFALLFLWPVVALAAPLASRGTERHRLVLSAWIVVLGALGYNLGVGGDWMPMFRFLAPAAPFLALLLGSLLARVPLAPRLGLGAAAVVLSLLPSFDVHVAPQALRERVYFRTFLVGYETEWRRLEIARGNAAARKRLGLALGQVLRPGETWTGAAIGATGYYSGVHVLDRNGLVNRSVAQREVEPGGGTAGHEKRVPRSWFRGEEPSFYEVFIVPRFAPRNSPAFANDVHQIGVTIFEKQEEPDLRDCTVIERREARDIEGLPARSSILLLKHTDDQARARSFWQRFGH